MCITRYLARKGPTEAHIKAREQSRIDAMAARKRGEMEDMKNRIAKLERNWQAVLPFQRLKRVQAIRTLGPETLRASLKMLEAAVKGESKS